MTEGWLPEVDGHRVRWATYGAADAPPLLALPPGPGTHLGDQVIGTLAALPWRVVTIDPRGTGRSTWGDLLAGNTTAALVDDLERLRQTLGIERWTVIGHLWGTVLALLYAQRYPQRCSGLVLNSVYLGEHAEVGWFFGGAGPMVPQTWDAVLATAPVPPDTDIATFWARWLAGAPADQKAVFCRRLMAYDIAICRFRPGQAPVLDAPEDADHLRFFTLFLHYLSNRYFLEDGAIVSGIDRVRHIPCRIVQGRFDLASATRPAYRLASAWPEATFTLVDEAGCGYLHEPAHAAVMQALAGLHPG